MDYRVQIAFYDVLWISAVTAFVVARFVWPTVRARKIRRLDARADDDPEVRQEARAELMGQLAYDAENGLPLRPEVMLRLAELEILDGLAPDAIQKLEQLEWYVSGQPLLWQTTLLHLANAYLTVERPERAVDAARRAIPLHPDGANLARAYLVIAFVEQNQPREALEALADVRPGDLSPRMRARLLVAEARAHCNSPPDQATRNLGLAEQRLREVMRQDRPLVERLVRERASEPVAAIATRLLTEQGPYR
jgi:hypothetical protein